MCIFLGYQPILCRVINIKVEPSEVYGAIIDFEGLSVQLIDHNQKVLEHGILYTNRWRRALAFVHSTQIPANMAQQIALQPIGNYDTEGLQQLQDELRHEDYEMQRQTSEEVRNEQLRIRQIFRTVRDFLFYLFFFFT